MAKKEDLNEPPKVSAKADTVGANQPTPRITGWKKWVLRLVLMLAMPTLLFGVVEGVLSLSGYGVETSFFIDIACYKFYTVNDKFGLRFFPEHLSRAASPCRIPSSRSEDSYRIFVLGGSATVGTPSPAHSFSRYLEMMLRQRFPGVDFEIINCGMTAVNSHVVRQIAAECANHDPDLLLVYMGNNEVVGPFGPGTIFKQFSPNLTLLRASMWLKTTCTGQLMGNVLGSLASDTADAPKKWTGLEMFMENLVPADDPRLDGVYAHFEANLADICDYAFDAEAKTLVCTVLTNLKDCPPFASVHTEGLAEAELDEWKKLYANAGQLEDEGKTPEALEVFLSAAEIDRGHAELQYRMGRCLLKLGRTDEARTAFAEALRLDALRFRCDQRENEIIRQVARSRGDRGVYLADLAESIPADSRFEDGMPGSKLLHAHVHMNFDGNYAIASRLFERVVELLPENIRSLNAATVSPPSQEACEERLGLTVVDRYKALTDIRGMMSEPPFTNQLDHDAQIAALTAKSEALAPACMESIAQIHQAYADALRRIPSDIPLRSKLASFERDRRNMPEAQRLYSSLLETIPGQVDWLEGLATVKLALGEAEEAIELFDRVLSGNPTRAFTRVNRAAAMGNLGRMDEAIAELRAVIATRPDLDAAHSNLIRTLLRREETRGDALEACIHWVEAIPRSVKAHRFYANLMVANEGDLAEAERHYKQAMEIGQDGESYRAMGRLLLEQGRSTEALDCLRSAIKANDRDVEALLLLAYSLAMDSNPAIRDGKEALEHATRACVLTRQSNMEAIAIQAIAYAEAGQFDEAVESANTALDMARRAEAPASIISRYETYLQAFRAGQTCAETEAAASK